MVTRVVVLARDALLWRWKPLSPWERGRCSTRFFHLQNAVTSLQIPSCSRQRRFLSSWTSMTWTSITEIKLRRMLVPEVKLTWALTSVDEDVNANVKLTQTSDSDVKLTCTSVPDRQGPSPSTAHFKEQATQNQTFVWGTTNNVSYGRVLGTTHDACGVNSAWSET